MSIITILLIVLVALLAGMEGVLDEFQFHQPLVACTLIGIVSGHMKEGIILGGSLQMMALGWANVGAAIAPDAALASVASAIIMVLGLQGGATDVNNAISTSIAVAVPLSVAGLFLTMICRTIAIPMVHFMDAAAEKGNIRIDSCCCPVRRISGCCYRCIESDAILAVRWYGSRWRNGCCSRVCHGYQHDGNKGNLAVLRSGLCASCTEPADADRTGRNRCCHCTDIALIYLGLKEHGGSNNGGGSSNTGDPLGDILNDY